MMYLVQIQTPKGNSDFVTPCLKTAIGEFMATESPKVIVIREIESKDECTYENKN